ncbi:MAG: NFACT family protein, partial [Sporomusaceae bacterium]|nr:NFACT family protein [Sporomusaceae bacterium]
MSLDGWNLAALAAELSQNITGSRIDKIVQYDKYTLVFTLRSHTKTNKLVLSANPEQIGAYLTDENQESPLQPPSFCMLLRKHFEDGRIGLVRQQELDRIIIMDVDTI